MSCTCRVDIRKLSSFISRNGKRSELDRFLQIDCKSCKIDINDAHFFFHHMLSMRPSPPISYFSTLLGAMVKCNHFSVAISFYKTLDISGVLGSRSNPIIISILIHCYSRMRLGSAAFSALGLVLKNGYRPDIITFSSLVKGLCLEGKLFEALGLLSKMIQLGCTPDVVTYNTIIDGLCKTGNAATSLQLHQDMVHGKVGIVKQNCKPCPSSYVLIDGRCVEWPTSDTKEHKPRIVPNVISYSCLIDGLCRSGLEEDAKSLIVEMIDNDVHPNVVTFSIMINSLCKKGKVEQAMEVLEIMMSRGEHPNRVTYNTLVDGFCRTGKMEEAMCVYNDMNRRGILADCVTINSLLKGLFHLKKVEDAMSLFINMKRMDADGACGLNQVTYATMTDGLCKEGDIDKAKGLFLEMQGNGLSPDVVVYASLINGLCKQGQIGKAEELFSKMLSSGVSPNVVTYSTLIDGYCKAGMFEDAHDLFLEMNTKGCSPNIITFHTLIKGYCKAGLLENAHNLLLEMEAKDCPPNVKIYNALIGGFAREKNDTRIEELLQKMHANKIFPDLDTMAILSKHSEMVENCQTWINSLPDSPHVETQKINALNLNVQTLARSSKRGRCINGRDLTLLMEMVFSSLRRACLVLGHLGVITNHLTKLLRNQISVG